jgi:hypothetical protein
MYDISKDRKGCFDFRPACKNENKKVFVKKHFAKT